MTNHDNYLFQFISEINIKLKKIMKSTRNTKSLTMSSFSFILLLYPLNLIGIYT